jgi:hypothetical protein
MAMTEQEWLACKDPASMVAFVDAKGSGRKKRLFAVACCRRIWSKITDPRCHRAVEVAERFADGLAYRSELEAAIEAVAAARREKFERDLEDAWHREGGEDLPAVYDPLAAAAVTCATDREGTLAADIDREYRRVTSRPGRRFKGKVTWVPNTGHIPEDGMDTSDLIRELFGNPFRPVTLNPAWRTSNVTGLAQSIYDDRAFDRLPILADALEDAGCDNADILNHCRQPGEHVRGCWVVDLVLGRE